MATLGTWGLVWLAVAIAAYLRFWWLGKIVTLVAAAVHAVWITAAFALAWVLIEMRGGR